MTLQPGLYERLITKAIDRALTGTAEAHRSPVAAADAPRRIATHLAQAIERAVRSLPPGDRMAAAVDIANGLVDALGARLPNTAGPDDHVMLPGEILTAIESSELGGHHRSTVHSAVGHGVVHQRHRRAFHRSGDRS